MAIRMAYGLAQIYIPLGYLWSYLKAGISHSCGVTDAGITMCWGRSREGQGDVPAGYSALAFGLTSLKSAAFHLFGTCFRSKTWHFPSKSSSSTASRCFYGSVFGLSA